MTLAPWIQTMLGIDMKKECKTCRYNDKKRTSQGYTCLLHNKHLIRFLDNLTIGESGCNDWKDHEHTCPKCSSKSNVNDWVCSFSASEYGKPEKRLCPVCHEWAKFIA